MKSRAWDMNGICVVFGGFLSISVIFAAGCQRQAPTDWRTAPSPAVTAPSGTGAGEWYHCTKTRTTYDDEGRPFMECVERADDQENDALEKAARALVICNTEGQGAYLRKTPGGQRIIVWPDGTVLELQSIRTDRTGGDFVQWAEVKDPQGNEGWVSMGYLCGPTKVPPVPPTRTSPTKVPACTDPNKPRAPSKAPPSSDCYIKGNISEGGEKIYHLPAQRYYEQTVIEERKGERWFRTPEEAEAAGWRRSKV